MNRILLVFVVAGSLLVGAALAQVGPTQDELDAAHANARDWLYATRDYGGQRFAPLAQIDVTNADDLGPVCMYQVGEVGTFQANPIVYAGVMYVSTPATVVAIDAANCRELWRYSWEPREQVGVATQRGVALKDGLVVRGTVDGHLIALDATNGQLVWASEARVPGTRESVTMAPLIYDELIVVGPAGTNRGWVRAFDLRTGDLRWHFDTIPGPNDDGADTWGDTQALVDGRVGGGSVWTVMAFDRERELLFVPVGSPDPAFYGGARPGDNLYTNSVVILDIRSGSLHGHVQLEPHGLHGWDTSHAGPLFTTTIGDGERNLMAATGKHGRLHIVDRDSQEVLFEVPVTTMKNTDEALTAEGVHVCPGYLGGVQWNGAAYSASTNLLYVPAVDWCSEFFEDPEGPRGGGFRMDPIEQARGWVTAVDPRNGSVRWRYAAAAPMIASVTVTSGDVLFTGSVDGTFLALNARTGDELYRFNTGGAIAGGVVTYEIDGRQLVAAVTGNQSGLWGSRGAPTVVIFGLR
jgi:alcohol dehydrogenase (cytochrome c)